MIADLDNLMGRTFEDCCRHWVGHYADEGLSCRPEQIGSWWSRDGSVEIDIVGVRRHRFELLGSCTWQRTVDEDALDELYEQRAALGGKAARARLALFARDGFTDRVRRRAANEDIMLVTATDLLV